MVLLRARNLRQLGSDSGSSKHLSAMDLGKPQPDEATSTLGRRNADADRGCTKGVLAQSTTRGLATERKMPARSLQSTLPGCVGCPDEGGIGLKNQQALHTASASCVRVPQEGEENASCSLHGRGESHGMMPQSHAQIGGLTELDFQHCNQAAPDSSSNTLQQNSLPQEEHPSPPGRQSYGHEAHECCQHEIHLPHAQLEPGTRSVSAAATKGQWPPCSDRAAENGIAHTPCSSRCSLGSFVVAAEQGASGRARPRSSMVFEVA